MRIALVILHADAARGGAERYTLDLASGLSARGHAVSILASSFQSGPIAAERVLLDAKGLTRTGRYRQFLNLLDQHLSSVRYDVVHAMLPVRQCDFYHPHAGIAAEAVAAGHRTQRDASRKALAWVGNRTSPRRQMFARTERKLLEGNNPPVTLCLSRLIQSVVTEYYPHLAADRMIPLFNGIDLERFKPTNRREARQDVRRRFKIAETNIIGLMLAHDFERKGLDRAIRALAELKDPQLKLLVGGKGSTEVYEGLAIASGVAEQVIFCGPVSQPVDFYQAVDFFVLPTRFDPCSLVVLEALVMGLPVISTRQNGACEVMTDGVHGRVLDNPNDIPMLSAAMRLLMNSELRSKMSSSCLQLRDSLSQAEHLRRLEQSYAIAANNRLPNLEV